MAQPAHRFLDPAETHQALLAYQQTRPHAWNRLATQLGLPSDPDDPRWPDTAAVRAIAFTPQPRHKGLERPRI